MLLSGRFLLTTASIRLISPQLTVKDRTSTYRALLPFLSCLPPPPRYQSTSAVSYQVRLKKKVTRMWKYSWRNIETFSPLLFPWQHSVGRIGGNFNKISWNKFWAKSRFNPAAPMPEMSPNLARRRFVPAGDALDLAWGHWEGGRALKVDIERGGWGGREGCIEDGGQSFLGTRTCVTQTCTKDQVVPELWDGEVWWQGKWNMGRGLSLGFGKVFDDQGSVWQIQLLYFWLTSGKNTFSVVHYWLDELQALLWSDCLFKMSRRLISTQPVR